MKLPISRDVVPIDDYQPVGPYPPKGFVTIANTYLGCSDYWGYYWPYGKEQESPLFCCMYENDFVLNPAFSSFDHFISVLNAISFDHNDPEVPTSLASFVESHDGRKLPPGEGLDRLRYLYNFETVLHDPSLEEDPRSPAALIRAANEAVKRHELDCAMEHLEVAVQVLPEFTAAWNLKARLHRRRRESEQAAICTVHALRCPIWLGWPDEHLINQFRTMPIPGCLAEDPLVLHRDKLSLKYYGTKTNDDYPLLLKCVDAYFEQGEFISAIHLHQKHGLLMSGETVSFQERYGFTRESFDEQQSEYFERYLGDSRRFD